MCQSHSARSQAIDMPWRPPGLRGLAPFCFEISLLFESNQERIERPRFHTGLPAKIIAVRPFIPGAKQGGKDQSRRLGEFPYSRHVLHFYLDRLCVNRSRSGSKSCPQRAATLIRHFGPCIFSI